MRNHFLFKVLKDYSKARTSPFDLCLYETNLRIGQHVVSICRAFLVRGNVTDGRRRFRHHSKTLSCHSTQKKSILHKKTLGVLRAQRQGPGCIVFAYCLKPARVAPSTRSKMLLYGWLGFKVNLFLFFALSPLPSRGQGGGGGYMWNMVTAEEGDMTVEETHGQYR